MKSGMITFDQAFYERIIKTLDRLNCRGFSYFQPVTMAVLPLIRMSAPILVSSLQ